MSRTSVRGKHKLAESSEKPQVQKTDLSYSYDHYIELSANGAEEIG